jgi:hypothetical protein
MTRGEWLARCGTVYDLGLAQPEVLRLLAQWADAVLRLEHTLAEDEGAREAILAAVRQVDRIDTPGCSQLSSVIEAACCEWERLQANRTPDGRLLTLANDPEGYAIIRLLAVLTHPCQQCAEDPGAWHTRPAFCKHER